MSIKYDNNFLNRIKQDRSDGLTQSDLQDKYNLTHTQIKYVYRLLHNQNSQPEQQPEQQFEFGSVTRNSDGSVVANKLISLNQAQNLSDTDILEIFGYNSDDFKLDSFRYSAWGRDKQTGQPLVSAKITISPVKDTVTTDDFIDAINNDVEPVIPTSFQRQTSTSTTDQSLVIPLFDMHFGITDLEVAYTYLCHLEDLISNKQYRDVVLVFGGDTFHSDFMTKTQTAKNTQLDHVNNKQALKDATEFFDDLIRIVNNHAKHIDVLAVGGNHDFDKQYLFMYAMSIKWQKFADFHLTTETRQYFQVGHVMLAVLHGDQALNKIANLMSTEQPKMWADCTARIALSGHFHKNVIKQVANNDDGVMLYQCSTIKPSDQYEADKGFTMSGHKLEVFTLNDHRVTAINYLYNDPLTETDTLTLDDAI
ncbi:metallophosphoesterase family protein [Limosilactobacillus reuteri]|uniref:metallophosphoesterase family protein n=1 Tax=Limosilactobacillus reuteri TaxID=1598 RepID=UPI002B05A594|nr:metallophosphoesterase family protein [Limosilactobacillus reuteri]